MKCKSDPHAKPQLFKETLVNRILSDCRTAVMADAHVDRSLTGSCEEKTSTASDVPSEQLFTLVGKFDHQFR